MAAVEEIRRRVEEVLRGVPAHYVVARTGSLCWNLRSADPTPGWVDLGWDLSVDLRTRQFELTHSNDWREEPGYLSRFEEAPTEDLAVPDRYSASNLPLLALDRDGELLAFILEILREFQPNTDCPT